MNIAVGPILRNNDFIQTPTNHLFVGTPEKVTILTLYSMISENNFEKASTFAFPPKHATVISYCWVPVIDGHWNVEDEFLLMACSDGEIRKMRAQRNPDTDEWRAIASFRPGKTVRNFLAPASVVLGNVVAALVAVGSEDGRVKLFQVPYDDSLPENGAEIASIDAHRDQIHKLEWVSASSGSDTRYLVTCCVDGTCRVWKISLRCDEDSRVQATVEVRGLVFPRTYEPATLVCQGEGKVVVAKPTMAAILQGWDTDRIEKYSIELPFTHAISGKFCTGTTAFILTSFDSKIAVLEQQQQPTAGTSGNTEGAKDPSRDHHSWRLNAEEARGLVSQLRRSLKASIDDFSPKQPYYTRGLTLSADACYMGFCVDNNLEYDYQTDINHQTQVHLLSISAYSTDLAHRVISRILDGDFFVMGGVRTEVGETRYLLWGLLTNASQSRFEELIDVIAKEANRRPNLASSQAHVQLMNNVIASMKGLDSEMR
ncbi:hypothetical protein EV182_001007 [Spiromyces aspiralis]|uniref:Uncharacterized protein n=1 Tax=Spiromyces aspiralis TaxID=68401 RepID=A0ACC1HHA3_9FUNG|nr:hypothetical protein EV182_001007 [Spiromyces aspiralis]